jgi:WD40 repeat protein
MERVAAWARWLSLLIMAIGASSPVRAETLAKPTRQFGLGDIAVLELSADSEHLATRGRGGAYVWNALVPEVRHRLDTRFAVTATAFSPDSRTLLTAAGVTVVAWDVQSGARLREFPGHRAEITELLFARHGELLLSASADNSVRVWNFERAETLRSIEIPGSSIVDIAVSSDGSRLATIDTFLTHGVKIWDLDTGANLGALLTTNRTFQKCLFTPTGELVTAGADRSVLLWDVETGQEIGALEAVTDSVLAFVDLWLPNEFTLGAMGNDGTILLWNLQTTSLTQIVPGELVLATRGVPGDFIALAASLDHTVRLRQLPSGDTLRAYVGHTTSIHSAARFSPDGRQVLTAGVESSTRLWDRQTGQLLRVFPGSAAGVPNAAFSRDGARVLTTVGLPNPAARLWNTETGELEREFPWTGSWPTDAAISNDGTKVAVSAQDDRVRVYDVATGALTRTWTGIPGARRVAFAPHAPLLAAGSGADFTVTVFHHETGQAVRSVSANAGPVTGLEFSPTGDALLVAWQDGLVRVFDATDFTILHEFAVPAAFLDSATFSPDAKHVLTGESFPEFSATLWNLETGAAVRRFPGHNWIVGSVAFSADGASVLVGADVVREWSIADMAARLRIEAGTGGIQVHWSMGQLERGTALPGVWEPVPEAQSPFSVPTSGPAAFFRVRVE